MLLVVLIVFVCGIMEFFGWMLKFLVFFFEENFVLNNILEIFNCFWLFVLCNKCGGIDEEIYG